MPTILESGHKAAIEAVQNEAPAKVQADFNLQGAEASVNTTVKQWTITAYVKRLWKGTWEAGGRVERPLGFFSRKPRS